MDNIKYVVFDFETSDIYNYKLPPDHKDQAWPVQLGILYLDKELNILLEKEDFIAPPSKDSVISEGAQQVHGISIETCFEKGIDEEQLRELFKPILSESVISIGHNVKFDFMFLGRYIKTLLESSDLAKAKERSICTMQASTYYCKLPPTDKMKKYKGLHYKNPKLEELYKILFNEELVEAHDALTDVKATHRCFKELIKLGVIKGEGVK